MGRTKMKDKDNKSLLRTEFMKEIYDHHNCSWARDIYNANRKNMNKPAIFYRGNTITYRQMFDMAYDYAKSLKMLGVKKGMEIPMCLANCPETIYIILAASLIGAKINIFGNTFNKDYIKEIINGTDAKVLFVTDDMYEELKGIIPKTNVEHIVMFSLTDSYLHRENPYFELEKEFYRGKNMVPYYKSSNKRIISGLEFEELGVNYIGEVEEESTLDDIFSITYSSGSTDSERPKAIMHKVMSFNAMGVAHNGQDTPKMKDLRVQVQIPTHSNTCIISSIADTLSQGCTCTLEYIYNERFFPISLQINKPNFAVATKSFWVRAFKIYDTDRRFEKVKLPFLIVPMAVGEATSPGEEKYFNKSLRKYKAGTDVIPLPVSPITMSMAGGDCEHGGIFFIMFKALKEQLNKVKLRKEPLGYSTYRMVEYAVLDEEGNHCMPYEQGTLVANSPCNMAGYKNDEEATAEFYVTDSSGKKWGNCTTYGYLDRFGAPHIKGRIPKKEEPIPPYIISDEILKDTKNILSCEVIYLKDGIYVAHIEPQPGIRYNRNKLLYSIEARLSKTIPADILEKLVYRIRDFEEGYPLTHCGKRSNNLLRQEQLKYSVKVMSTSSIEGEDGAFCIAGEEYLKELDHSKKLNMDKQ